MKPYQKFMGGKTNFLYLRICCYFHLVPVCANFRFWLLCVCVCVCAAGFVYFCEGWRHIL